MEVVTTLAPLPTTTNPPPPSSVPKNTLRRLLFGAPFSERVDGVDPSIGQLDCLLGDLLELLRAEHGTQCRAFGQAEREITDAASSPSDVDRRVAAKRGILLFAIWRDPAIARRFEISDATLLAQLRERVLPVIGPGYLANLGQRPDSFVYLCAVLTTLWDGMDLKMPEPREGEDVASKE